MPGRKASVFCFEFNGIIRDTKQTRPGAWVLSALGAGRRSYCLYRVSEVIHICCFRFFLFIAAYGNVDRIIKRYDAFFDSGYVLAVYNK